METFISLAPFPVLRLFPNFLFVNFFKFQYWKTTNCFKSFSINTTCLATKQTYQDNPFDVHSYQLNMCFVCSGLDEKQIARIFLSDVFTGKRNSKTTSCFPEASSKSVNWLWMLLIVLKLPSPPHWVNIVPWMSYYSLLLKALKYRRWKIYFVEGECCGSY